MILWTVEGAELLILEMTSAMNFLKGAWVGDDNGPSTAEA